MLGLLVDSYCCASLSEAYQPHPSAGGREPCRPTAWRWVWQGAGQGADEEEAADVAQQVTGHVEEGHLGWSVLLYTSHPLFAGMLCKVNLVKQ